MIRCRMFFLMQFTLEFIRYADKINERAQSFDASIMSIIKLSSINNFSVVYIELCNVPCDAPRMICDETMFVKKNCSHLRTKEFRLTILFL